VDPEHLKKQVERLRRACGHTPMRVSAAARTKVTEVLRAITGIIDESKAGELAKVKVEAWQP